VGVGEVWEWGAEGMKRKAWLSVALCMLESHVCTCPCIILWLESHTACLAGPGACQHLISWRHGAFSGAVNREAAGKSIPALLLQKQWHWWQPSRPATVLHPFT